MADATKDGIHTNQLLCAVGQGLSHRVISKCERTSVQVETEWEQECKTGDKKVSLRNAPVSMVVFIGRCLCFVLMTDKTDVVIQRKRRTSR